MFTFDDDEIIKGLKKYPVLSHFSESALKRLVGQSKIVEIDENHTLFSCDEPADSVYYLIEGHLEGFSSNSFKEKVTGFRGGELVGEIDVIAGESRGMTVKAMRNSRLLKIDNKIFNKYFQHNPELFVALAQSLAKRLRTMIYNAHDSSYEYKNIGLIVLFSDMPVEKIKETFQPQVAQDAFHLYDKNKFEESGQELVNFFCQCESNSGINLFFCVNSNDSWSKAVLNHVDYIYLITWGGTWDTMDSNVLAGIRQRPCDIAILHKDPAPFKNTARFYDRHPFKRHHHLMDTKADYERLYRYMTGQAIGLVVSGGGFRGFAHYGLIKALFESKIPIDYLGGSSMGALIAAILALDFDREHFDTMFHCNMKKVKKTIFAKNITIPLVSMLSGKTLTNSIYDMFGEYQMEDLKTNFFCVVTNLSNSKKEIMRKGKLWEWIRASTSIPGIAPPFEKEGVIYVDGAVCSNLPINDMRILLDEGGKIIAFNLQNSVFNGHKYNFPPILTMKKMLLYLLGFAEYRYNFPSILDILTEAPLINQYSSDSEAAKTAELIISFDTSSKSFRSTSSDVLIQPAYELAQEKFLEKIDLFKRWIV